MSIYHRKAKIKALDIALDQLTPPAVGGWMVREAFDEIRTQLEERRARLLTVEKACQRSTSLTEKKT